MIDPTFNKVIRLFVLLLQNRNEGISYDEYCIPAVEIKDDNVLIVCKIFFDISIKKKEKSFEKTIEMGRNNDYATGNFWITNIFQSTIT